jgi:hypothetical protein
MKAAGHSWAYRVSYATTCGRYIARVQEQGNSTKRCFLDRATLRVLARTDAVVRAGLHTLAWPFLLGGVYLTGKALK